ncbi:SMC-Scp complex subunit ScpB [Candidatus Micrarchaeota archaeon]|nr:SMC-Scp complex subunit ScpB [Candidatus Micrarchaeota archaeon]
MAKKKKEKKQIAVIKAVEAIEQKQLEKEISEEAGLETTKSNSELKEIVGEASRESESISDLLEEVKDEKEVQAVERGAGASDTASDAVLLSVSSPVAPAIDVSNLDPARVVEAALFMSGKPLSIDALGKLLGTPAPGYVKGIAENLAKEYTEKNSAIVIIEENNEFVMRLKNPFAQLVKDFAQDAEVSHGALKMLAFISRNEGIQQSKMVDELGTTVYQYVKELSHNGFVEARRKGRTKVLKTTKKFKDYFSE